MMQGIVDRIEEDWVVCEMEEQNVQNLPLSAFSVPPKSGDVFVYEQGIAVILPDETAKRRESVQSLFERLKKKK